MQSFVFLKSSLGKKYVMAVTGLMLFGFVCMHMIGNLLIFAGQDHLNAYAKMLSSLGELLWVARAALLAAVAGHIWSAVCLTLENRRARPEEYRYKATIQTTLAAKTMMISGLTLLAFIIYHLLHFTLGKAQPEFFHLMDAKGRHDVYSMVIHGFQNPVIAASYIIAMSLLCMHLSHGIASTFQSLGFADEVFIRKMRAAGRVISLIIFMGYASIPLSVWTGLVRLPQGVMH